MTTSASEVPAVVRDVRQVRAEQVALVRARLEGAEGAVVVRMVINGQPVESYGSYRKLFIRIMPTAEAVLWDIQHWGQYNDCEILSVRVIGGADILTAEGVLARDGRVVIRFALPVLAGATIVV